MALTQTLVAKITVELALELHYLYIYLYMNTTKNLLHTCFPIISSTLFQTDTNAPMYVYTKQYNRTALCISIMYHQHKFELEVHDTGLSYW
jgi:hypothetical protein